VVTVHNFTYGVFNPALGYVMSCLGAFLGLRCVTRARVHEGRSKARWLILAAVAIGACGIWVMHFVAMLGFTIPGQAITYNVPVTIASMLLAIAVVGAGLFLVGYGDGSARRLAAGGVVVGIGVASMHYLGMAAMIMPDTMSYNPVLLALSVVIAVAAGTVALWIGTWVRGIGATIGASLVMGVAVSGMHYTGMAAMHVHQGAMGSMPMAGGASPVAFLFPLLLGISVLTLVLTLTITMSPSEEEIREDIAMRERMEQLQQRAASGGQRPRQRSGGIHW
jgi:NO-binding membrane sensor protein with MHYT domain